MAKRKRKSGEGTVRRRKDGRWEGRVVVGYDEKGLPKTKNVTAKTKTECIEKLEKLKAELGAVVRKCTPTMPFGEWMDFWFQTYCKNSLKEYTQVTYAERIYKQIIPKIGHIPLNQINTGTLEKFYAQLKSNGRLTRRETFGPGLANSVIRSIHAHCRAALEKAVAEKLIKQNPAIGCKLPPKKSPEVEILTPEEMQKLLFQAQIDGFYEMFTLDLATGLRRGELIGLQWKDIDFEKGTLSVTKQVRYVKRELQILPPKTKASIRTIILPEPILEMLAEYRKIVNSIWLFPSPYKTEDMPRDPSSCRKALARILERSGCKHVPFHALRHTFASHAFHYGMDVKTLASTIGHESVETTLNIYAHSSEQMKRDAARKIDESIGTALGADLSANAAPQASGNDTTGNSPAENNTPKTPKFEPYVGKRRRSGTGSVHQVSKNVWEGRYSPIINGKRIARNIYANSEEECEIKLAELIRETKEKFGIK
ncbi:MAG: site-specific integrase [Clostridia bacterium]|nr:site-specific integrase [Clostridia bacterium]